MEIYAERKFEHVISLGYFCTIAMEMQRYGLRDSSMPFDWLFDVDWTSIEELWDNHFMQFLDRDLLYQEKGSSDHYWNVRYNIGFFHDFDGFQSLDAQLGKVQEKYNRRIERFYKDIQEPTLFVRYIKNREELEYIEQNYDIVLSKLKSCNQENAILFISNDDLQSECLPLYTAEKDENDFCARKPTDKNAELRTIFYKLNYDQSRRMINLKKYQAERKRRRGIWFRVQKRFKRYYKHYFVKYYIHDKIVKK